MRLRDERFNLLIGRNQRCFPRFAMNGSGLGRRGLYDSLVAGQRTLAYVGAQACTPTETEDGRLGSCNGSDVPLVLDYIS